MNKLTFRDLLDNNETPDDQKAFGYLDRESLTYGNVKTEIKKIKSYLIQAGIGKGDKVALLSANQPHWGLVYLAVTTYGAIIVPILPDFTVIQIENILIHSECKMIFLSEKQTAKMEDIKLDFPQFSLDSLTLIKGSLDESKSFTSDLYDIEEDDIAALLYTSGTTGNSKGVMLSNKNLISNVQACFEIISITAEDRFLSLLPLAHTYECTVGFLFPFSKGASVTYLEGAPTPRILMDALAKVKPTFVLSVPLLIEKIYRSKVAAKFNAKKFISFLYKIKPFRILLNRVAGKKLLEAFGGSLRFFGIGGAPLAPEVETFLKDSHFPYSIGYGLTETAPLLAGDNPSIQMFRSTGKPIFNGKLRIDSPKPEITVGEIQAWGPNIMKGYFKDPEKTAEVFTEDGWFKTGDLGTISKDGRLFIRGREKNLILGSNGENIYPEEIESILNENEFVAESIIMEMGKELVAMIYLNADKLAHDMKNLKLPMNKMDEYKTDLLEKIRKEANNHLNIQSRLSKMIEHKSPFEKTPSLKIKRFLYHKKK
ncbi:MAG: AMP-binding protein [Spirochaetaceae bacterium]|jgi:long-chain acyl-CoA synthetase|nr:AMP-binding protein [Spirochaetaceae bacterium]